MDVYAPSASKQPTQSATLHSSTSLISTAAPHTLINSSSNATSLRLAALGRDRASDRKEATRDKTLLILILHYLRETGHFEAARALVTSSSSSGGACDLLRYQICDNADLYSILQSYEIQYLQNFQRVPKIVKKLDLMQGTCAGDQQHASVDQLTPDQLMKHWFGGGSSSAALTKRKKPIAKQSSAVISSPSPQASEPIRLHAPTNPQQPFRRDLSLLLHAIAPEHAELGQTISREIVQDPAGVSWDDVKGLDKAKALLKEAVVYPLKYPELFRGVLSPWRGILLHGPPGTGKTMLARAVANECRTTFFNISASSIVSKWRGESEKLVRVLFDMARQCAPSTIFLDELDTLMSHRGVGGDGEHEASRRMKAELLIQMDGLRHSDDLVFVLAASNLPWDLDSAALRRLEKRIFVDLPSPAARVNIMQHYLPRKLDEHPLQLECSIDYERAAQLTEGYSGADVRLVCKEAAMRVMRDVFEHLEAAPRDGEEQEPPPFHVRAVSDADLDEAIARTKPASSEASRRRHVQWKEQFESA